MRKNTQKWRYFALVNFNLMLFTLGSRFCFMNSLLTAYIIVYIPYWSNVKSRKTE